MTLALVRVNRCELAHSTKGLAQKKTLGHLKSERNEKWPLTISVPFKLSLSWGSIVWLIALILAFINITYLSRFLSYSHFFVLKPKNWTRHGNHDCASYRKLNTFLMALELPSESGCVTLTSTSQCLDLRVAEAAEPLVSPIRYSLN